MSIKEFYKSVVKIYSQNIDIDWQFPFKFSSAAEISGTGFFIHKDGYLLTCSHVVEAAKKVFIEVQDEGNQKYEVIVVGFSPDMDIALLKTLKYKPKKILKLGHSNKIKVGDTVHAVGYPLGLDNLKITKGVLSGRQFGKLQMDTPISGGNSGGPLMYKKQVVGICASSLVGTQAQNINFAVPIELFYNIKDRLLKDKYVRNTNLGVIYYYTSCDLLSLIINSNNKCDSGIYIVECFENSPLHNIGVRKDTIITKINGNKIDNKGQLFDKKINQILTFSEYQEYIKLGSTVKIEYYKDGKYTSKKFMYTPFYYSIQKRFPVYEKIDFEVLEGLVFMDLSFNHLDIYPMISLRFQKFSNRMKPRVIISGILPGSYFSINNLLQGGMLVKKVNDIEVNTVRELRKVLMNPLESSGNKFIKIETDIGIITAMNLKNLKKNTLNFRNVYKFKNRNNTINKLL